MVFEILIVLDRTEVLLVVLVVERLVAFVKAGTFDPEAFEGLEILVAEVDASKLPGFEFSGMVATQSLIPISNSSLLLIFLSLRK